MAIVLNRSGHLHIQWYDTFTKKTYSKTTGLKATSANNIKAKKLANKLQIELTKRREEAKQMGVSHITIKDAFEHFLNNNQMKHPKTIEDYKRFYRLFILDFNEEQSCTSINKITVEEWLIKIKKMPLAKNTIHGYGKQLNHFLNFLFEYSYTPMFKINRSVRTRPEVKEKIVFKDEHLQKIFQNLDYKNSNFKAAIYLLFHTGLRSSDLLTITVERVDMKDQILCYYSPKRKKFRSVPFQDDLKEILNARITEVKGGQLLDYNNIENLGRGVNRYLQELDLRGFGYSARTFRKTFITLCRSRFNMDASIVRELVGHEQGNTTDRYYNQISIDTMRKELDKFNFQFY